MRKERQQTHLKLLNQLNRNTNEYDQNFERLLASVGTSQHQEYVKEERRLNKINEDLLKKLHL